MAFHSDQFLFYFSSNSNRKQLENWAKQAKFCFEPNILHMIEGEFMDHPPVSKGQINQIEYKQKYVFVYNLRFMIVS